MEILESISKIFEIFQKNKRSIDKVVKTAQKVQSGLSSSVTTDKVSEAQGTLSGTLTVNAKKDLELDQIRLSFNQYIYHYTSSTTNEHRWKEYFVGTRNLEGFSLSAGESKAIDFQINYELELRDDERKKMEKKGAGIKEIMKMGHFRKGGAGMGVDWTFQLVVVYVLSGGEEIKDVHQVKIDK